MTVSIKSLSTYLEGFGFRIVREEISSRLYLEPIGLQEQLSWTKDRCAISARPNCAHCGSRKEAEKCDRCGA